MSIADHFEHAPDAGFVRDFDSESARRQFKVSTILIAVIALAATALALLIRFDYPTSTSADFAVTQSPPAYVGKL